MMILTVFVSICMVAVLFLLRFLVATELEIRSARKSSPAFVKHLSIHRIPSPAGANGVAPELALVHSAAGRSASSDSHSKYSKGA